MKKEKVYLVDLSDLGFRCGIPAEIIGVYMAQPKNLEPRLCYHLMWSDGVEDYKPVNESQYKILTFTDILSKKYKQI